MPSSRSAPRAIRRPAAIRCSCGSCSRRCRRRTCGPTGLTPTRSAKSGPRAVSRTVLLRLARLPPDAVPVARAVAVLGDGAGAAAPSRRGPDRRAARSGGRARPGGRGDPAGGAAARLRAPAGARRRVPRPRRGGARAAARARGKRHCWTLGAAPELVAAQLLAVAVAAPSHGSSTLLREAALAARRRGATESAVLYLRRALEEPPPAEQREQLLLELGLVEGFVNPPAAVAHISQVHDQLVDPQVRAQAAAMLGRMLLFTGPAQAAATVVQRRAGRPPGRARGHAAGARGARALHGRVRRARAGRRRAARARARRRAPEGARRQHAQRRCRVGLGAAGRHRAGVLRARTRGARRRLADRPGRGVHGPRRRQGARRRRSRRSTAPCANRR